MPKTTKTTNNNKETKGLKLSGKITGLFSEEHNTFSTQIANKNADGSYTNQFINITFSKEAQEIFNDIEGKPVKKENYLEVSFNLIDGWLRPYKAKNGTTYTTIFANKIEE